MPGWLPDTTGRKGVDRLDGTSSLEPAFEKCAKCLGMNGEKFSRVETASAGF
jgi:hypothetical protein